MNETQSVVLTDFEPEQKRFRDEVLAGLAREPRTLPCKYLYDQRGSELFEQICELPEYYPTRTELRLMEARGQEMAETLGPQVVLIEYGSGSSAKTRVLLEALADPVAYVPVDISRDPLVRSARSLDRRHPRLEVLPVWADFTQVFTLPSPRRTPRRRIVYFPGSTIGNFDPPEVVAFLARIAALVGPGGGLIIGVDLLKDSRTLQAAYDDAQGVTADFNKNLLSRLNRELGADFDLEAFEHRAVVNEVLGRVEMHLVSRLRQEVRVCGERFSLAAGESIHTESSYKYSLEGFAERARQAGLEVQRVWTDPQQRFSVQSLTPR
ncbi:MAG: L-histidine N(alpha)-methyltransferase [Myxococcota bacterium]